MLRCHAELASLTQCLLLYGAAVPTSRLGYGQKLAVIVFAVGSTFWAFYSTEVRRDSCSTYACIKDGSTFGLSVL